MPRLPPVPISPHTRLRARFCPGVIESVVTFFQSHSSSSATSWARPVLVPWPISVRAMRIMQVSSGLTTTQALTSTASAASARAGAASAGRWNPSARPPPAAVVPTTKVRRESFVLLKFFMADLLAPLSFGTGNASGFAAGRGHRGRHVHRLADALVGAAATDIGHRLVDVLVGRLRGALEEGCRGHDLAGLAVAALRHVDRKPCLLHGMRARGREALDGDDLVGRLDVADPHRARPRHLAIG